jgi:hypothetical protein
MKLHRAVRFLAFGLLLLVIPAALSSPSSAQIAVGVGIRIGPPALPIYAQPTCPGPGYHWTPGYWAWNDEGGYYWVPGTWVVAPIGMLWTPGYWGWGGGFYAWHAGYWGPHVGFYGGINYGFGYGGVGFVGGEWRGGAFFYNRAVVNVNTVHVTNVYENRTVVVNNESHVAFNGGEGGVAATPTAAEQKAASEPHQAALSAQTQHEQAASQNKASFASENHGAPAVAATAKPGDFSGKGAVAAKSAGAPYHAPAMSPKEARAPASAANHASTPSGSSAASKSFTPPSKSNSGNEHASTNATNQEKGNTASESKSTPHTESKPENSSKPQKQQKQPKANKHNPPKEEHDRGRGR